MNFLFLLSLLIVDGALSQECDSDESCEDVNAYCYQPDNSVFSFEDIGKDVSGYCSCKDGYVYIFPNGCTKVPELGDACNPTISFCNTTNSICENSQCVCAPGYQRVSGKKECARIRLKLGQECNSSLECASPFAVCEKNRCTCAPGFNKDGEACVPTKEDCPYGEALMEKGKPRSCTPELAKPIFLMMRPMGMGDDKANASGPGDKDGQGECPPGYDCHVKDWTYSVGQSTPGGRCCPTRRPICPEGLPHPNATCDFMFGYWGSTTGNGFEDGKKPRQEVYCPPETYFCRIDQATRQSACCLLPCKQGDIHSDSNCLPPAKLGERCQADVQCNPYGGQCKSRGSEKICRCPSESVEVKYYGDYRYCSAPYCPTGESPAKASDGEFLRCNRSDKNATCPADHSCVEPLGVCCPEQDSGVAECPVGTKAQISADGESAAYCSPGRSNWKSCDAGFDCTYNPSVGSYFCCSQPEAK